MKASGCPQHSHVWFQIELGLDVTYIPYFLIKPPFLKRNFFGLKGMDLNDKKSVPQADGFDRSCSWPSLQMPRTWFQWFSYFIAYRAKKSKNVIFVFVINFTVVRLSRLTLYYVRL